MPKCDAPQNFELNFLILNYTIKCLVNLIFLYHPILEIHKTENSIKNKIHIFLLVASRQMRN